MSENNSSSSESSSPSSPSPSSPSDSAPSPSSPSESSSPNQSNPAGQKPDFIAYNVTETRDGKGVWDRIGAAWRHKDGHGYEVALNSLPVDGRVTLRELREERMQDQAQEREAQKPKREISQERGVTRSR